MHKFKTKKYIIFFVIITIIFIIVGFIFYNNNKSIIKDKYMREITFYGYKPNEITPIMCSEMVGDLMIDNLNYLNTLEDLKLFKKLELIHIGDIWNAPEENVISEKKLDKFIKQLNETFVILPNLQC